jgi:hypothetical protein
MGNDSLSFTVLDERIREIPDGPSAVLNTPRWLVPFNMVGTAGLIVAITPFLVIQFAEPKAWMIIMARFGLWLALLGHLPGIARGVWVIFFEFWRWRQKLVAQSDHDMAQFGELRRWLRGFPRGELEDHYHFALLSQQRLTAKLGLMQGGFDKLGILPALLGLLLLLSNTGELTIDALLKVPLWQSVLALMFAILYFIGMLAVLMRLRLQLYEAVLADALNPE